MLGSWWLKQTSLLVDTEELRKLQSRWEENKGENETLMNKSKAKDSLNPTTFSNTSRDLKMVLSFNTVTFHITSTFIEVRPMPYFYLH